MPPTPDELQRLREQWTGCCVRVREGEPLWQRFLGRIGRVVTVNANGCLIIDFADGAWYDLPAEKSVVEALSGVDAEAAAKNFDPTASSAQAYPSRQS